MKTAVFASIPASLDHPGRLCAPVLTAIGLGLALGLAFAQGAVAQQNPVTAVDIALEFNRRYPHNPFIAITSLQQSRDAAPKHSSGKTLYHVVKQAEKRYLIDNCMPAGDVSITVEGREQEYKVCLLSSIGALTVVHSLNELTIRELVRRGQQHLVLQNMHLGQAHVNYEEWLADQRRRYAKALSNPARLTPVP